MLEIIAEKTGYPKDMLDLDLDLEADLGIDTVKQAEMFAAIRAAYDIPREENRKLRDYPTLAHAIRFVYEKRPDIAVGGRSRMHRPPMRRAARPPAADPDHGTKVLEIIAAKTGYPPDMLDLDLDLEADLGIDTVKQAEMFAAIRAAYDIPREENRKLRDFPTLAHMIQFVTRPQPSPAAVRSRPPHRSARPPSAPEAPPAADPHPRARCWRSSPRRPAIRPTCSIWTSTSKRTWGSIPSSRRRCSPPCARPMISRAKTTSSCATSRRWPTHSVRT